MTTPTDKPKNRELSPREWEALRVLWITEGKPHVWRFLAEHGHPNRTGSLGRRVKKWQLLDEIKSLSDPVDNVVHLPNGRVVDAGRGGESSPGGATSPMPEGANAPQTGGKAYREDGWALVLDWREKQSLDDYRTADRVRTSIKLMLSGSIEAVTSQDGKVTYRSKLKPAEARQLSQALEAIQRVQRLALGLSTDNIGVNMGNGKGAGASGAEVEKPVDEGVPTFVVEMNRGGKFIRARPRRAQ